MPRPRVDAPNRPAPARWRRPRAGRALRAGWRATAAAGLAVALTASCAPSSDQDPGALGWVLRVAIVVVGLTVLAIMVVAVAAVAITPLAWVVSRVTERFRAR